jgi:transposase
MAKPIVSAELWAGAGPLLPPEPEKPRGGRPRVPNRDCLRGIFFVLRASLPWPWLPPELGCGSGTTRWRRLKGRHEAGLWKKLHQVLLERLADADQLDWSRASVDSFGVPAVGGAQKPARIRLIEANRARSAILWPKPQASRSRSR